MLRVLHMSDTHGILRMPTYDDFDVVVHSGDLMPNKTRGNASVEVAYQEQWIMDHRQKIADICQDKPFVYTPGNHDYYMHVDACLWDIGVECHMLSTPRVYYEQKGVTFGGFPWVKEFTKEWNFEVPETEINELLNEYHLDDLDVLVSHGPPYGYLDDGYGSKALRDHLLVSRKIQVVLCGHIHEHSGGIATLGHITISNAACTYNLINV